MRGRWCSWGDCPRLHSRESGNDGTGAKASRSPPSRECERRATASRSAIEPAQRRRERFAHHPQEQRAHAGVEAVRVRSEEHTSELQSLMRISYAVFCLKKQKSYFIHSSRHYESYSILSQ